MDEKPIPSGMVSTWVRERRQRGGSGDGEERGWLRLLEIYGVTEACVRQTAGEVLYDTDEEEDLMIEHVPPYERGQHVRLALLGNKVCICCKSSSSEGEEMVVAKEGEDRGGGENDCKRLRSFPNGNIGEIVLSGNQINDFTDYYHFPPNVKFVTILSLDGATTSSTWYYYRTGDRGYLSPTANRLHILGRIQGESKCHS